MDEQVYVKEHSAPPHELGGLISSEEKEQN
jgi:hypothetical protein